MTSEILFSRRMFAGARFAERSTELPAFHQRNMVRWNRCYINVGDSVYHVYHNNLQTCNFTTFTGNIQLCISWIYTITHLTSHEYWWCSRVYTTVIMHILYISYHVHIIKIDTVRLTGDIWLHIYLHVSWPYITYIIYNIVKTYLCSNRHLL